MNMGSNPCVADREGAKMAIHYACLYGHWSCTSVMMQPCWVVQNADGLKPLAQALITDMHGQNRYIDARTCAGLTPLHMAAWAGHVEVAKILLANGAYLNPKIVFSSPSTSSVLPGSTPTHLATRKNRIHVVRALLSAYVRPSGGHCWCRAAWAACTHAPCLCSCFVESILHTKGLHVLRLGCCVYATVVRRLVECHRVCRVCESRRWDQCSSVHAMPASCIAQMCCQPCMLALRLQSHSCNMQPAYVSLLSAFAVDSKTGKPRTIAGLAHVQHRSAPALTGCNQPRSQGDCRWSGGGRQRQPGVCQKRTPARSRTTGATTPSCMPSPVATSPWLSCLTRAPPQHLASMLQLCAASMMLVVCKDLCAVRQVCALQCDVGGAGAAHLHPCAAALRCGLGTGAATLRQWRLRRSAASTGPLAWAALLLLYD